MKLSSEGARVCVCGGGGHNILTTRFDLTADAPSVSLLC